MYECWFPGGTDSTVNSLARQRKLLLLLPFCVRLCDIHGRANGPWTAAAAARHSTTRPSRWMRLSSESPCLMTDWYSALFTSGRFVSRTPATCAHAERQAWKSHNRSKGGTRLVDLAVESPGRDELGQLAVKERG